MNEIMVKFREAVNHSEVWACVTVALIVLSVFTNAAVLIAAVVSAFQFGCRVVGESYESGIVCSECGDKLDYEDDPRNDPDSPYGLSA